MDRLEGLLHDLRWNVDDQTLLRRLVQEAPLHPLVVAWRAGAAASVMFVALAFVLLLAPLASGAAAELLAWSDAILRLPTPMVPAVLAVCACMMSMAARGAGVDRGRHSGFLPGEQRLYQHVCGELQRMRSMEKHAAWSSTATAAPVDTTDCVPSWMAS